MTDYRKTARLRQSIHFSRIQVLFADHVHRRSGVDNKVSFLKFKIWWRRQAPILRRWEECCFIFSFDFRILLASLHAASRAHRSCHSVSSWDRSSNFGALGSRWWGSLGQIIPSDGFWSRMSAWRTTALVNRTHRIGFRMSELFRIIDEDFGGSISWNTQPNWRVIFNIATACHHSFWPVARLFFNLAMRMRAPFTKSASILRPVEQAFWRMPFFTVWIGASSFQVILAGQSKHSSTGTLASGTSGSRRISLFLPRGRARRRIRLCRFWTLIHIVSETAIVSCRTLAVSVPLPTIS